MTRRATPLLGLLFVVLVAAGFIIAGDSASHHALGSEIRDVYDNETQHQTAAFLVAVAAVPLLFFAGWLRVVLTDAGPRQRVLPDVALAGAGVAATGLAVQSLIHATLAEAAGTSEFPDAALQSLNALDGWSFYPFAIGAATFLLAAGAGLVGARPSVAPLLGWPAVILGVLTLVPIVGLFAAPLAAIWVAITSIVLFTRGASLERPQRADHNESGRDERSDPDDG